LKKGLKISLIILLAITGISCTLALVVCTPYIAGKVRIWKLTRDMTGGTSLIYEIDTTGISEEQRKDLSIKMIAVLQKRINPHGNRPILWRPLSDTRFEIRMPLADAKTIQKRNEYDKAKESLLAKNINRQTVLQVLDRSAEERANLLNNFSQGSPDRLKILNDLVKVYDERTELQTRRDNLFAGLKSTEKGISSAGFELEQVKSRIYEWSRLDEQKLTETLAKFSDANDIVEILRRYVKTYSEWAEATDNLSDINPKYKMALAAIDNLNLSEDQLEFCLELSPKSARRLTEINKLKEEFPDRILLIDKVVATFDQYRPFRGRLDNPKDIQRMLKGAGILEFRVLPTEGHPDVDMELIRVYVDRLQIRGPEYASDNDYKWCEIENYVEWRSVDSQNRPTIVGTFGEKYYVLASNKAGQVMLHSPGARDWKLDRVYPTSDYIGRRAIGFVMDYIGGKLMADITGKNIGRPLCILLDDIAISAPCIEERIPGRGIITGNFTETETEDIINKLNAGSLPARLIEKPIEIKTIGEKVGP
jgi:SecD/SecF fusion protein